MRTRSSHSASMQRAARSRSITPKRAEAFTRLSAQREKLPVPTIRSGILKAGGVARHALFIPAPKTLSIQEAREEFLGLITEYQWRMFVQPEWERGKFRTAVLDLSSVERLTLDAALVTTAEYDRIVRLNPNMRSVIDDRAWEPNVRSLFQELGLQQLVGAKIRTGEHVENGSGLTFMPFISGELVHQQLARQLLDGLEAIGGRAPERAYIYTALVEAIKNVKHHAYPDDTLDRAVPSIPRWWAAAAYDPSAETLQFVVYDQGIGIPSTLPRRNIWKAVKEHCPAEFTDADVIVGGIAYGRSRFQTAKKSAKDAGPQGLPSGRGNGLWAICRFIPEQTESFVRILSGRGEVTYRGHNAIDKSNHEHPFCGTLIQWNIKLPPLEHGGPAA